jgi:hypothetical protein
MESDPIGELYPFLPFRMPADGFYEEPPDMDEEDERILNGVWDQVHQEFMADLLSQIQAEGYQTAEMHLDDAPYHIVRAWRAGEPKAHESCSCGRFNAVVCLAEELGIQLTRQEWDSRLGQQVRKDVGRQPERMACVHDVDVDQTWWHSKTSERYNRIDFSE